MPRHPARTRRRAMDALADALLPPGSSMPGGCELGLGERAVRLLDELPGAMRVAASAELAALEHLPLLLARGRFSSLPRDRRQAILATLGRLPHPLVEAVHGLTALPLFAYGERREVLAALGVERGPLVPLAAPLPPPDPLPTTTFPDLRPGTEEVVDVVVVGSGAGGAPVARTLARAGWSVAVVEEGRAHSRLEFSGPELERMRSLYRGSAATTTIGRPPVLVPIGRAVGGTTVVNSGTCFRTPEAVIAQWSDAHGLALAPEELEACYEDVEATLGVAPVSWETMGANGRLVHAGATALGIPGRPIDRNASGCHGSGVCAVGCPLDGKRGVNLNYLPQAVMAGAEILAGCRVDSILLRGRRAVGVTGTLLEGEGAAAGRFTIRARRGVVVAAGAPLTPGLLRRSGIRAGALGRNFRIHPAAAVVGVFDEEVRGWRGVLQSYLVDAVADRGIMLEATFPPPALALAELGLGLAPEDRMSVLARLPHMAALGLLVSDTSAGRVIDLGSGRVPFMRYDLNRFDAARVREGMLLAARILFAAGAREILPPLPGAPAIRSADEAEAELSRERPPSAFRLTAYHPMGTARMGADPDAVTDDAGRVHGAERLAVSDASLFPSSLGVNPQVTIMAFATRVAARILEGW